jgi:hypothetical protein
MAAGWQLYRMSPGMWTLLVFTWWVLVAMTNQLPYIGPVASTVVLPAFMMSFMVMCDELRNGRALRPSMLFAGFQKRLPALLTLGALYLLSIVVVLWLSSLVDGGVLLNWVMWGRAPPEAALHDGTLSRALMIAALLATPVLAAFWFAPVLAAWDGMSAGQSLFYSFFAFVRNWRAFLLYGVAVIMVGLVFSVFVAVAAVATGGHPPVIRGFMLAATLIMLPTMFASFYVAYRDIFPAENAAPVAA